MCTSPNYMVWNGKYTSGYSEKKTSKGVELVRVPVKELFDFQPHCNYEKILKAKVPFVEVGCGHCLECRQQHSSMWADRCTFEAKQWKYNYFITLTYDDKHFPEDGCLHYDDLTKFIKRLRSHFKRKYGDENIRYFACGEYGSSGGSRGVNPHFHIIFFNLNVRDLSPDFYLEEDDGRLHKRYRPSCVGLEYFSKTIYDLWEHKGFITVAPFSYNTAAYVAGYVLKKAEPDRDKKLAAAGLTPEDIRMSTSPGIGENLYDVNLFKNDIIIVPRSGKAKTSVIPRYYEKLLDKYDPLEFVFLKDEQAKKRKQRLLDYEHADYFKDDRNEAMSRRNLKKIKRYENI